MTEEGEAERGRDAEAKNSYKSVFNVSPDVSLRRFDVLDAKHECL